MRRILSLLLTLSMAAALGACGNESDDDGASGDGSGRKLVVYSGRNENLVRPIIDRFAEESGIEVEVRYADTTELTATLLEEGDASPADVFFAQDAGALAALAGDGRLAELPATLTAGVDPRFVDPDNRFTGITGRARTLAFNPAEVPEAEVPTSIFEVADPKWKGRIGLAPANASFVSHVSALRAEFGDERVAQFLEALAGNDPQVFDSNTLVVQAVAGGEVELGLVNHYYALNERKERPDSPVVNAFPEEGAFVNLAGVGILEGAANSAEAEEFIEFLLSEDGQEYFRTETNEYPLVEDAKAPQSLPPIAELETIKAPLAELGKDLQSSVRLIEEAGLA